MAGFDYEVCHYFVEDSDRFGERGGDVAEGVEELFYCWRFGGLGVGVRGGGKGGSWYLRFRNLGGLCGGQPGRGLLSCFLVFGFSTFLNDSFEVEGNSGVR